MQYTDLSDGHLLRFRETEINEAFAHCRLNLNQARCLGRLPYPSWEFRLSQTKETRV